MKQFFFLHSTFVNSCTLGLCCLFLFYFVFLSSNVIHSWLVFLSTIIGRSVWYLVFGMHNYLRPSDCPCVFCEVFFCISLHRNLPGSLVSLWKTLVYQGVMCLCCSNCLFCEWLSEIFSRCLVSLFFKISVFNRV